MALFGEYIKVFGMDHIIYIEGLIILGSIFSIGEVIFLRVQNSSDVNGEKVT